ncbi:MAG: hypothetical protein ACFFE4_18160 [Candidatus Thorarchaeota archaeon]
MSNDNKNEKSSFLFIAIPDDFFIFHTTDTPQLFGHCSSEDKNNKNNNT